MEFSTDGHDCCFGMWLLNPWAMLGQPLLMIFACLLVDVSRPALFSSFAGVEMPWFYLVALYVGFKIPSYNYLFV